MKNNIIDVPLYNEYISLKEIQDTLLALRTKYKKHSHNELRLLAKKIIIDIDMLLFGYLLLFKNNQENLDITLYLPYNDSDSTDEMKALTFKLLQAMTLDFFKNEKSLFTVEFKDKKTLKIEDEKMFKDNVMVSGNYFQPILITKETYPLYFKNKKENLKFKNIRSQKILDIKVKREKKVPLYKQPSIGESIYQEFRRSMKKNLDTVDRYVDFLHELHFVNSLLSCKILELYIAYHDFGNSDDMFKFVKENNIHASRLTNEKAFQYFNDIKFVFEELKQMPAIYSIIYSTLISSIVVESEITSNIQENVKNKIISAWKFTKEMADGLNELAKNLIIHSSRRNGVILGRAYSSEMFKNFKYNIKYKENDEVPKKIYEFNIIDNSTHGITETFIDYLKKSNNIYEINDYEILKDTEFDISNMFDIDSNINLNHQMKRAVAHIGLLKFTTLITGNNGLIKVSTINQSKSKSSIHVETLILSDTLDIKNESKIDWISTGSHINVLLPIDFINTINKAENHISDKPFINNQLDLKNINDLVKCNVVYDYNLDIFNKDANTIYINNVDVLDVCNRCAENELKDKIMKYVRWVNSKSGGDIIVVINLKKVDISDSELYRLIGFLSFKNKKEGLIIAGVKAEVLKGVYKINNIFQKSKVSMDYWNKYKAILIYSYYKYETNKNYNFVDLLWGDVEETFLMSNEIISENNSNLSSILNSEKVEKIKINKDLEKKNNDDVPPFLINKRVLPFDLLIKNGNNSLFEENTHIKLTKEMGI